MYGICYNIKELKKEGCNNIGWTIKTVNECWKCKHLQKSVYTKSENETLYNCWCIVGDMESKEKCNKFEICDKL